MLESFRSLRKLSDIQRLANMEIYSRQGAKHVLSPSTPLRINSAEGNAKFGIVLPLRPLRPFDPAQGMLCVRYPAFGRGVAAALVLIALAALGLACFWFVPPIAQPQWYHNFADRRAFLGIPNFWNVVSNLPFLLVGVWAIRYLASADGVESVTPDKRWMYLWFFAAVALTSVGSGYYHLEPNNERLVWDRLPIALTFMALLAIIVGEFLSRRAGVLLFAPLAFFGAATVFYWHLTETWGRGDLRPYLLAQIYPVVAIPVILWLSPVRYTRMETLYAAMAWYAGAKVYEFLDQEIYSLGRIVSGHTLKHVGAAVSCYLIWNWIRHRRPDSDSGSADIHVTQ